MTRQSARTHKKRTSKRRQVDLRLWPLVCAARALVLGVLLGLAAFRLGLGPWPLAAVAGASLTALVFYGADKRAAIRRRPRVPEFVLLGLALLGGSPGALAGMLLFRHKTKKGPFLVRMLAIMLVQAAALLVWRLAPDLVAATLKTAAPAP